MEVKFLSGSKILLLLVMVAGFVCGCAHLNEATKEILGTSTKELEAGRQNAIKKTVILDYNSCYAKVKEILINNKAYIYSQDKDLIAIYVSAADTTPVGLFFTAIDAKNTQVEVSSPSTYSKELIAKKVFAGLPEQPQAQKGKENAQK